MVLFKLTPIRAALILLVMSILAFAPGITNLPVLDRDEARFAQASKQMMEAHDFIDIRFQDEARHKKPVGIYWAQVISSKAFDEGYHTEIWPYRVPSLLGAILAVLFTFWGARAVLSTSGAFTAGLILLSSILLMAEARIAKTDASLLFTICMAQAFFVHIWVRMKIPFPIMGEGAPIGAGEGRNINRLIDSPSSDVFAATFSHYGRREISNWHIIGFWLAIGGGILLKGPITPMVLAFTILGLCLTTKDWRILKALNPLWGLGIVLAICAPWFIAITLKSNGAFFAESVGKDLVAKVGSAQEKHGAPPLTYFALLPVLFWPWAGVFFSFIGKFWQMRQAFVIQWLFWWIVPTWILFELIPTKLPHYVLPTFPALAIGLAYALHTHLPKSQSDLAEANWSPRSVGGMGENPPTINEWKLWQRVLLCLPPLIGVTLVAAAGMGMQILEGELHGPSLALLSLAAITSIFACIQFHKRDLPMGILASVASGLIMGGTITAVLLPNMPSIFLSERINTAVRAFTPCEHTTVGLVGYYEPSVVFLLGTQTKQLKAEDSAAFLKSQENHPHKWMCNVVVLDTKPHPKRLDVPSPETQFLKDAAQLGIQPKKLTEVTGRNMNGGRDRVLSIWALEQ